ncbi:MAG: carboxylesterase family protein [Lachnospiraceae bacterium]|nr:carboxylesterase family protein [Lachnospiraceae bacterium]
MSENSNYYVETPCGPVRGIPGKENGTAVYRGIRYAVADRFEYPKQVTHWGGTYQADSWGNCSYQPRSFYNEADMPEKAFYYNEFRKGEAYTYSEDCLFLNIWTPKEPVNAPVLFYIHGGGFKGGCGHEKHFDGTAYNRQGIIVVTINYRLGPLGFCSLPEIKEKYGHSGNFALYDQLTALKWVRDNIRAFGGDPDKITIMGQSAGAISVQQLCLSPLTAGMFSGAVMCSGGGVGREFGETVKAEETYDFWQQLRKRTGVKNLKEFSAVSPEKLLTEFQQLTKEYKNSMRCCGPVRDGVLLKESGVQLAKAGKQQPVYYLTGSTSEDIIPPIVHKMAKSWSRLQSDKGKKTSYTFFFDRQLPGDDCGAWHSSDLWYEFGTLSNGWRPFTKWDYELSDRMVRYFSNFIKTGNPNGEGLTEWLPMEKGQNKVMRFGNKDNHMGGVSVAKLKHTMMTKTAVGE